VPNHVFEESHFTKEKSMEEHVQFESNNDRFSNIPGNAHTDSVPEGQIVNQTYYEDDNPL
jgi:hypothetical protein